MGYWSQKSKSLGNQYLNTQSAKEAPFCTHNYQVTLHSKKTKNTYQALGSFKIRFGSKSPSLGQVIDNSETIFKSDTISTHLTTFNEPLKSEDLRVIFMSYEKTSNIFTSWLYDKEWAFKNVEVFLGEEQKKLLFCPKGDGIVREEPVEFELC